MILDEAVRLCDERASLEATFLPGAGMLCASLRHHGDELLAQNAGVDAYVTRGKTMGIPLLYPWANRLAGFTYNVAGRTVEVPHDSARVALDGNGLPIHGVIGGRLHWQLAQPRRPDSAGQAGEEIAARLGWSESQRELFEIFPFRHDLEYRARLGGGRMEVEVTVQASGEDAVPVAFGFHPYLAPAGWPGGSSTDSSAYSSPDSPPTGGRRDASRERWSIELPAMRHLALDASQIPTGLGEAVPAQCFELGEREFDDGFDSVAEPASFSVTTERRRIQLDFLQGYPCAQVYAPRGSDFICFEPMTAQTNALQSGTGLRVLAPGERYTARFSLQIAD